MINTGRAVRESKRRAEYRQRSLLRFKLFLIVIAGGLIILSLNVRNIKTELMEIKDMLEQIEILQYEIQDTLTTAGTEKTAAPSEDYVNSVAMEYVEKPVQRTFKETIQRLEELGQENPVIEEISQNTSAYPEGMLTALANNPEMAGFVAGYVNDGTATGGLTDAEKQQDFPLLLQWDPRWGYQPYGDSCIGIAGCGPTCLSMVMLYLTGDETLTPDAIADYAMEQDYYVSGTGTAWALMDTFPISYGIKVSEIKAAERAMKNQLDQGAVIICSMGEGDFTVSGHFIVIFGYDEAGFKVNDPNCVARSRKRWAFEEIRQQIKKIWAYQK